MSDLSDLQLAALGHMNRLEFERTLARWSGVGGSVCEADGVLTWSSASDFPVMLNGAAAVDPTVPPPDVVRAAASRFDALGRGFSMALRDGDPVDDRIRTAALDAGLVALSGAPEMVVTEPVEERELADGVELTWLEPLDPMSSGPAVASRPSYVAAPTVADFVEVSDTAYQSLGMPAGTLHTAVAAPHRVVAPGTTVVVATVDGRAAGAAMALLSHGIAGVYFVGTLEAARGRGIGDAVTRAVTNRAFDDGARAVTLQASAMGEAIYARMGYRELYRYTTYVRFSAD